MLDRDWAPKWTRALWLKRACYLFLRCSRVECSVSFHCSAATGPVMVKLRFEREKARESGEGFVVVTEEIDLEVHASEGLEMFKFQVGELLPWSFVHVFCPENQEIYPFTRCRYIASCRLREPSQTALRRKYSDLDKCFPPWAPSTSVGMLILGARHVCAGALDNRYRHQ